MEKPVLLELAVFKSVRLKDGDRKDRWWMKKLGETEFNPWTIESTHAYHGRLYTENGDPDEKQYYIFVTTSGREYITDEYGHNSLKG
jgi:hypothetical protein